MKTKKTYAVLGLGRYGIAVANELIENGMEVMAVDVDQKVVDEAAAYLPVCKCADITDADVIAQLGIANIDTVIVSMASNLEASIVAVTLCKEAGVKNVIVKCANEMHQKILRRVGADHVVFPENESGIRLAKNLLSSGFVDMLSLSEDVSIVEVEVKDEWVGKNLIELNLRKKHGLNIVAIKHGEEISHNVDPEQILEPDMVLIVIAEVADLEKMKR